MYIDYPMLSLLLVLYPSFSLGHPFFIQTMEMNASFSSLLFFLQLLLSKHCYASLQQRIEQNNTESPRIVFKFNEIYM